MTRFANVPAAAVLTGTASSKPAEPVASRGELLLAYSEWLFYERRLLMMEMYPGLNDAESWVPANTLARGFHFPTSGRSLKDVPSPSTRALALLKAVGVDVRPDRSGVHDGDSVAPEGTPWEPIGGLKFGPANPERPIVAKATWTEWKEMARIEYVLSRAILPILNASDDELEARVRETGDTWEPWADIIDSMATMKERLQAGAEALDAAACRMLVVCERVHGDKPEEAA